VGQAFDVVLSALGRDRGAVNGFSSAFGFGEVVEQLGRPVGVKGNVLVKEVETIAVCEPPAAGGGRGGRAG